MSETKKDVSGALLFLLIMLALFGAGSYLGSCGSARRFERHGYVITNELGVEAVATVTPIFEEWRR